MGRRPLYPPEVTRTRFIDFHRRTHQSDNLPDGANFRARREYGLERAEAVPTTHKSRIWCRNTLPYRPVTPTGLPSIATGDH